MQRSNIVIQALASAFLTAACGVAVAEDSGKFSGYSFSSDAARASSADIERAPYGSTNRRYPSDFERRVYTADRPAVDRSIVDHTAIDKSAEIQDNSPDISPYRSSCDSCGSCGSCNSCGGPACIPCYHTCSGLIVGYEQTILKPHFSSEVPPLPLGVQPIVDLNAPPLASFDYEGAPRVTLGYVLCNGLGFRARYWGMDPEAESSFIDGPGIGFQTRTSGALNIHAVDLEATEEAMLGSWLINMSGGVRLARVRMRSSIDIIELDQPQFVFANAFIHDHTNEGVGPTIAVDFVRPITCSNFAIFGNGRCSLVFGSGDTLSEVENTNPDLPGRVTFDAVGDGMMSIFEVQTGVQWSRPVWSGARLTVRGAMEGQVWNDAGNLYSTGSDLGLFGFAIGVGLTR